MHCPKCQAEMETLTVEAVAIERCTACRGLWFDLEEHEELKSFAGQIDTGDATVGARHNAIDRICCPVCPSGQPLIRMVDPTQPHIWFESCTVCYGRFYDAGEYRDFAEFTVADWFRRLRPRRRD